MDTEARWERLPENWSSSAMSDGRPLLIRVVALIAVPALGWFSLVILPQLLPEGPNLVGFASTGLMLGFTAVAAFSLGYFQPRSWHVLGLVFAAPALIGGVVQIYRERGGLWPLALVSLAELVVLVLLLSFVGRTVRLYRARRSAP